MRGGAADDGAGRLLHDGRESIVGPVIGSGTRAACVASRRTVGRYRGSCRPVPQLRTGPRAPIAPVRSYSSIVPSALSMYAKSSVRTPCHGRDLAVSRPIPGRRRRGRATARRAARARSSARRRAGPGSNAREVGDRRGEVDVGDQPGHVARDGSGHPSRERRADALLVRAALPSDPVLAEREPVVGEEEDHRVLELAARPASWSTIRSTASSTARSVSAWCRRSSR